MSEGQHTRLERIAQHLINEGFLDNEADARLAAIRILLVEDSLGRGEAAGADGPTMSLTGDQTTDPGGELFCAPERSV